MTQREDVMEPPPIVQLETFRQRALAEGERVLVIGGPGRGKSTLIEAWSRGASEAGQEIWCLCADPGRPAFGAPGALALGVVRQGQLELVALEGLASLNPLRFRLPWSLAITRLLGHLPPDATLLVDAPGILSAPSSSELYSAILDLCDIRRLLLVQDADEQVPLWLRAMTRRGVELEKWTSHPEARAPSKGQRRAERDAAWAAYLEVGESITVELAGKRRVGFAPALSAVQDWEGRQVVLLGERGERTVGFGQILALRGAKLELRGQLYGRLDEVGGVLLRDAGVQSGRLQTLRHDDGDDDEEGLQTSAARPLFTPRGRPHIPVYLGRSPIMQGGSFKIALVGGLFDDPMVMMRLDHRQRCLLFDLGEAQQVPTKLIHQAQDVFVTHAHLDHFGGFPHLIRRRLGTIEPCRIIGPPGLADRVESMIRAFTWDRIEDRGPIFEVGELHEESALHWHRMQIGEEAMVETGREEIEDGVVLREPRFVVRAAQLDHGIPVLGYALEEPRRFDVRPEVLRERGWKPGRWLGDLKNLAALEKMEDEVMVEREDGSRDPMRVGDLVEQLLLTRAGQKLVYATDFADWPHNRERMRWLAQGAHLLIMEASFLESDADQAERTGHLTARSCGEIAAECGVERLLPFHLSARYEEHPEAVYREVLAVFEDAIVPQMLVDRLGEG